MTRAAARPVLGSRARLALAALLALAGACTSTQARTEVLLEVDADTAVRAQLQTLRILIDVSDDAGKNWKKRLTKSFSADDVGGWDEFAWPARLGLVPEGGDASRRFAVRAQALDAHGDLIVWQQAVAGFDHGRTTVLPVMLISACAIDALDCGDPDCVGTVRCKTCLEGDCVDVEPQKLKDFDPDRLADGGAPHDAGDAGSHEPSDAGDSDTGSPERDAGDGAMPAGDSGMTAGDAGHDSGAAPGPAPFHVVATMPSADTPVQDDTHGALSVTFSDPVDESTVTSSTFSVTQAGRPIAGSVVSSKRGATFTPDQPWELSAAYTLQLGADVESATGDALEAFQLDFSVRDGMWSRLGLYAGLGDPKVALASDGFGVLEWTNMGTTNIDVLVSLYSLESGWTSPATLSTVGASVSVVAANTKHHAVAVWSGISAGQTISAYTAGPDWSTPAFVSPGSDPALFLSDSDELFFVATNIGMGSSLSGYQFTLSASSPAVIAVGGSATNNTQSQVAVVGGNARVIWCHTEGAPSVSRITAGLLDSSDGVPLSAADRNASEPRLAATPSQTSAILVWQQGDPNVTGDSSIWAARIASGANWSAPVQVSKGTNTAQHPAVAIDDRGRAVATWQQDGVLKSASFEVASGWSTPVTLTAAGAANADPASVALAPDGNGLAVWTQDSVSMSLNEVYAARYLAGRGWSSAGPVRISDKEAGTGSVVSLAIDVAGRAFAAWYQSNKTWVARFE